MSAEMTAEANGGSIRVRVGMWPAWIALACSLALTLVAWRYTQQDAERRMRAEFEAEVRQLRTDLKARIAGQTQTLRGAAALFAGSDDVSRRDWHEYVAGLKLERDYPAIHAIAFARAVDAATLDALVREVRRSGVADFTVRPPGRRSHYVVNVYTEPYRGLNMKALGYDMWQDADRRATMELARASGEPAITRKTTLRIDERDNPVPAFIMYLPVPAKSGGDVFGYVLSPVRMPVLMAGLLKPEPGGIALAIHDGTGTADDGMLFPSETGERAAAKFVHIEAMVVGGRTWTLTYSSRPATGAGAASRPASVQVLAGGTLVSLLLFGIAWSLATTRDRALGLAREMTKSLRQSEARFRVLVEQAPDAIVVYDMDLGRFVDANVQAEKLFGCSRTDLLTLAPDRFYPPGQFNGGTAAENVKEMLERALSGDQICFERTVRNAQGRVLRCELRLVRLPSAGQRLIRGSLIDVTERKKVEQALHDSEVRFRTVFEKAYTGIAIADPGGTLLEANDSLCQLLGYSRQELVSMNISRLTHADDLAVEAVYLEEIAAGRRQDYRMDKRYLTKAGKVTWVDLLVTVIHDEKGQTVKLIGLVVDITARKAAEDEIRNLAFYDVLTHLPNRRLMHDRLRQALTASGRRERHGALMLFDLDDFKTLNDTLGHDVGDQFLVEVAARMASCIREGDTVARLGGDEFVVILQDLDAEAVAAMQAEIVAVKIQAALSAPYLLDLSFTEEGGDTRSYHCTSSVGIALFRGHSVSADELMKRADTAMYQAKASGRNAMRFFDPEMQAVVAARADLNADLRSALRESQFLVHYQPQVDGAGHVTGVEALVRWRHPRRGMVSPAEFIPQAEENGMILSLGHWVLETACRQLEAWADADATDHLTVAVNVSGRQFHQKDFVDQVLAVLRQTGADPEKLKLEVTESLLLNDIEDVVAKMGALKSEGISFALDDFGTGYSSLSYLKRLPLGQLKIDQSFVRDVLTDGNDAAIARTIIALGRSLGLAVIAEGVETGAQRDFLASQGCHAYQGYYFGRPVAVEELKFV